MLLLDRHAVPDTYQAAERLDVYLMGVWAALPTRKGIQKALKRGAISLNDRPLTSAHRVKAGEVYQLWEAYERPGVRDYRFQHQLVFEDAYLAVLHKPAGWVVSGNSFKTIQNCLRFSLQASPLPDALSWPRPVHRLDAPTSGLLLVAKAKATHTALGRQFADRQIKKTYRAIATGYLPDGGSFHSPIEGRSAHTTYTTTRRVPSLRNGHLSLLRIGLHTGRTHQIRRHFAQHGYALFGDQRYGRAGEVFRGKGLMLAATGLRFRHPGSGVDMELTLPIPRKFESLLRREERRWQRHRGG